MDKKYTLFHIEGGLGKHIMATAVAKCIKNNFPDRDLLVVCAYPEIFLNIGYVDKVFKIGLTPYFYQDYIEGKDTLIFKHEPYFTTDHIHKELGLIENWCKMFNLKYTGEEPDLIFNYRQQQFGLNKWNVNMPVMIIQTNGGLYGEQKYPYAWTRDLPIEVSQEIFNYFKNDYYIYQVTRPGTPVIQGAQIISDPMSNMELLSMLLVSQKRLFIDSCFQHAAAALKMKSTVAWIGTSSKIFGYDFHDNIQAKDYGKFKLPDSYLFDFNFEGTLYECPYMTPDIFDISQIIDSINSQK